MKPGVYLDRNNYNALVIAVKPDAVYYVNLQEGVYDVRSASHDTFGRQYINHLPDYPVRRCARIYQDSLFPKTENATKVLKHLLRS